MVTIREARIDDAHDLYLLNKNSLGYDFPEEKTRAQLEKILQSRSVRIYVAQSDNRAVGYVHAADYDSCYSESLKNVMALAVDGDCRRMGIGRMLMEAVEKWAKQSGSAGIRLTSGMARTGAHRFYESCGYIVRKESKNFFKIFDDK